MPAEAWRRQRFVVVGLLATAVHYALLFLLVDILALRPIGLANLPAALAGTTTSFIGNRRIVFRASVASREALPRFLLLYALLWLAHSVLMLLWADWMAWPYSLGFVLITGTIAIISYRFNARFVFRAAG